MTVVVIGAGVIGLTSALVLQNAGYKVRIVAAQLPGEFHPDYTSPWAGANWHSFAEKNDALQQEFDAVTFHKFKDLVKVPETGVVSVVGRDYYESRPSDWCDPWFSKILRFRNLDKSELPENVVLGYEFDTVCINTQQYLVWLQKRFQENGGTIEQRKLDDIRDAFDAAEQVDIVINCTGLQARYLGGVKDGLVYPTRGQVVIVDAPQVKTTLAQTGDYGITYIIPRNNGHVILGGTMQAYNNDEKHDEETAKKIMERACKLDPLLGKPENLKVVKHCVGFRPSRQGGIRIESQLYEHKGRNVIVCHNYGHGSYGKNRVIDRHGYVGEEEEEEEDK
ncbi:nucleotide-binding domain-containing protein [Basidiobolus meristosporus CBS 931.73]|uniref:Nucleotide-binding domain-containing protein n=1 Tax=Basidiobolus meristosporus CBS 931.73 TaxID=1314790 RepID=A0A1Y1YWI8_9FUNG|nr:nucleotide-binding domain-containing protein [Basidiobolus meristosporus CBS 931.73]|eukprot:ORY02214.1 nucleotide-binding domain-containing protein [Basidiobolus meristosporus CBS 931.73]